ncbi:membrane protein, HPP family [Flavobacterium limnosediminis JC2902]|uniref:Membrane protein, HPP family n=1 Tax=Flavobacterium limnosediminis JC2902 TaxID=1341181 RepID=V6SIK0_9FLAO|nr:HPP family protein [Flavobacterium limnosediminis]ESU26264.1 membrane protein, HPP family [Flavobacterium limnosediminis JC2902]
MPTHKIKRNYRKAKYVLYKETLVDFKEHLWAFVGAFVGIGIIAYLQYNMFPKEDFVFLIGSFGASSVLVYGVIQSPLAQPRNLIGGHVISAFVGVTAAKLFPDMIWLGSAVAVASAIVFMQITKTLHPPGGATALIAVTGSPAIVKLGYWYVITPVLSGAIILLIVALICNNMTDNRQYPTSRKFTKLKKKIAGKITVNKIN